MAGLSRHPLYHGASPWDKEPLPEEPSRIPDRRARLATRCLSLLNLCAMSSKDWIGYPKLVENAQRAMDSAQRGIVRDALRHVAKGGVMGNHHFYIAFDTRAPGVILSDVMKERFPELITIVLQNQFWNLKVEDDAFEVGLSFNKVPETLRVPFSAVRQFADPSQNFGLQFSAPPGTEAQTPPQEAETPRAQPPATPEPSADKDEIEPPPSPGPTIVSLDKFRKK